MLLLLLGNGSKPIVTIFGGIIIHEPAILVILGYLGSQGLDSESYYSFVYYYQHVCLSSTQQEGTKFVPPVSGIVSTSSRHLPVQVLGYQTRAI